MTSDSDPKLSVAKDLLLAEFANLRQEQFSRGAGQQTLININVTAAVALGGVVLSRLATDRGLPVTEARQSLLLLLLLPPLSFALGVQYYGQDLSIMLVGRYIDDHLRPLAQQLGGGEVFQWECHVRKHERGRTIRLVMTFDMLMLFPGIGGAALAFAVPIAFASSSPQPVVEIVWVGEALLTLVLITLWIPAAQRRPPKANEVDPSAAQ